MDDSAATIKDLKQKNDNILAENEQQTEFINALQCEIDEIRDDTTVKYSERDDTFPIEIESLKN